MPTTLLKTLRKRANEIERGTESGTITGLVVQGGGMRGTYSMAALMALEECGLTGAFDHVVASSAGAINGAYFLAHQAKRAVTVYLDDISNRQFVNIFRLRRIVDIDYLVDGVLKRHKSLDVERVRNSHTVLHVIMTDYLTGQSAEITNKDEGLDFMEAMRATAALPVLYNKIVSVKGRGYVDGGVTDSVPLFRAVELGCTDIMVVLTRPPEFRRTRPNIFMRAIQSLFMRNYPKELRERVLCKDDQFNRTMDAIERGRVNDTQLRLGVVSPSDLKKLVSRATTQREKLLACALMARNDVRRVLGCAPVDDNPLRV